MGQPSLWSGAMIRVMVVAAAAVSRAGLAAALAVDGQIEVVGTAGTLEIGADIDRLKPDVILLDLGDSPQTSVWEKLQLLQVDRADEILPIALYDWEGSDLEAAVAAGVRGILPDTSTETELCAAIIAIASGWLVLPPSAISILSTQERSLADPVAALTPREIEVLAALGAGLGNKAIAQTLHISEHTVKFHISSIFQKLNVSTRTEAVTAGIRMGAISI